MTAALVMCVGKVESGIHELTAGGKGQFPAQGCAVNVQLSDLSDGSQIMHPGGILQCTTIHDSRPCP